MPTIKELAQEYANRIRSANSQQEVQRVLDEINRLVYEENQKPISSETKESLLERLMEILDASTVLKTFDNKNYLALVQHMLQQLRNTKK